MHYEGELSHQLEFLVHVVLSPSVVMVAHGDRFVLPGDTRVVVPAVKLSHAVLGELHRLSVDVSDIVEEVLAVSPLHVVPDEPRGPVRGWHPRVLGVSLIAVERVAHELGVTHLRLKGVGEISLDIRYDVFGNVTKIPGRLIRHR